MKSISINFYRLLKAELYKNMHRKSVLLTILMPSVIIFLVFLFRLYVNYKLLWKGQLVASETPWMDWSGPCLSFFSFVFPVLIAVLAYGFWDMERQNDNLRFLCSRPVNRFQIYAAKSLSLYLAVVLMCVITWAVFLLLGYTMGILFLQLPFFSTSVGVASLQVLGKGALVALCGAAIQFFLSICFKNLTLPMLVAVLLLSFEYAMLFSLKRIYFPYTIYMELVKMNPDYLSQLHEVDYYALLWWGVSFVLGYVGFYFRKKV